MPRSLLPLSNLLATFSFPQHARHLVRRSVSIQQRRRLSLQPSAWQATDINQINEWGDLAVLFSRCKDIHWNLALEEWISQNAVSAGRHVLLFYVNTPAVVIGRMQNPWLEADVDFLKRNDVALARRRSGGGAVYHDCGNLNISFVTPKDDYRRSANVEWVARSLQSAWPGVVLRACDKGDLRLPNNDKVSGSAARITHRGAYHHCTLLVQADSDSLFASLEPTLQEGLIRNSATASRRSPISELQAMAADCTVEGVCTELAKRFVEESPGKTSSVLSISRPSSLDGAWCDVGKLYSESKTWEWTYGKTPRFNVHLETSVDTDVVILDLEIERCCIKKLTVTSSRSDASGTALDSELEVLLGMSMRESDWIGLVDRLGAGTFAGQVCRSISSLFWPAGGPGRLD